MPNITLTLTEDQYARYGAAVAKLHGIPAPTADDLLEPVKSIIKQLVYQSEVLRGEVSDVGWKFWDAPTLDAPTLRTQVLVAVERYLSAFARTGEFLNILDATSYRGDPTPKQAARGTYAFQARSAYRARVDLIQAEIVAGTRPMPTSADVVVAEIAAALPLVWPN
jgi:hypothetical protein